MNIQDRINVFEILFEELQDTNSRIDKEQIIKTFEKNYPELKEDWTVILETLDGKYPIGWTFQPADKMYKDCTFEKVASMIRYLFNFKDTPGGLTAENRRIAERTIGEHGSFIAPIVNRTLRLGIGKSLLTKSDLTPMLAKKYEGQSLQDDVYVTEKLDGNRCIAYYDGDKWQFKSRNGKDMKVSFDMTGLPTEYIYDGEIMSVEQTTRSIDRCNAIINGGKFSKTGDEQELFSKTSGIINSHAVQKDIVYNIFDIVSDLPYSSRREILDEIGVRPSRVRVVPVLYVGRNTKRINELLDKMCMMGGEGTMLNLANRPYEHKRTDALLKYKQVQYCDMCVIDVFEGKGKYEGMCGGLICYMITDDGREITCEVGTGLSDQQRWDWGRDKTQIIGKIVEVGYHEITHLSSLRFPRLIRVRDDKEETSEY